MHTSLFNKSNPSREKLLSIILIALFAIFVVLVSNAKLSGEDDLFWHLATARYILTIGIIPSTDVFGYITNGNNWIPFEWAWDILSYFIYKIDGFVSLAFFSTSLIALMYVILYRTLKKFAVNLSVIIACFIILTFGVMGRFTAKPQLITYLFLVLLLSIIVNYKYFEPRDSKCLYTVPLIFLAWANMHMGVLAGIVMLFIFTISEILNFLFRKRLSKSAIKPFSRNELTLLVFIFIVSLITLLINPHGMRTITYAFSNLNLKQIEVVYEWLSPFNPSYTLKFYNIIYYIFIAGIIPVIYYSSERKDIFPFLLYAAFLYHSTSSMRFTTDFLIASSFFFILSINFVLVNTTLQRLRGFMAKPFLSIFLCLLLAVMIVTIPGNRLYFFFGYPRIFGVGIDNNNFPVKMFDFIKRNGIAEIGERPFNSYETGGFFIWNFPGKKNFIDSRGLNDEVWEQYVNIINRGAGFEQTLNTLDPDYFAWFVPNVNYNRNPAFLNYGVISYLFNSPDTWKLIYWDDTSLLFVKNTTKFTNTIRQHVYLYATPYNFYYRRAYLDSVAVTSKEEIIQEIERNTAYNPDGTLIKRISFLYEKNQSEISNPK